MVIANQLRAGKHRKRGLIPKGPYTPSNQTQSDLLNVGRKLQIV